MDIFDNVRYFLKKKIFSENDSSGTCKTLKETKSRNLGSVAQSVRKRQTIFGRPGHNGPLPCKIGLKDPHLVTIYHVNKW